MGVSPSSLYRDEQQAKIMTRPDHYSAGLINVEHPLKFIDKYLNVYLSAGIEFPDSFEYSAFYSQQTGVCAVRLDIILHNSMKEDFLKEMKDYLSVDFNQDPIIKKVGAGEIIYWNDEKIDQKNISFVGLRYETSNLRSGQGFFVLLEYRFDNYSICRKHNPDIPN